MMSGNKLTMTKGKNWIMHYGNAVDIIYRVFPKGEIDFCFTSPSPYKWKHQPVGIGSEQRIDDYLHSLWSLFHLIGQVLTSSGSLMVHMVDGYSPEIGGLLFIPERFALMMIQRGWLCKGKLIWQRGHDGTQTNSDRFRHDWEYIYWFSKSKHHYFNSKLNASHTSIFDFASESGFPSQMLNIFIESCCPKDGVVLDPLCSTATTGEEALRLKRNFIGIEIIEEKYEAAVENLSGLELYLSKEDK
jgi:DNA modification methylase